MSRGFILQPTYRIAHGRPVVHLYGMLEGGGSFLVRDTRQVPRFWIRRADVERARSCGATGVHEEPDRRTMDGEPVARVEVAAPADAPPLRDALQARGIDCFEADVRFAYRGLIDRNIRGAVEIDGQGQPGSGVDVVYENPELHPGHWAPSLTALSIDIETDPQASRLLSVALVGGGADEVLLLTPESYDCPDDATACATERELLQTLVDRVREIDPDVITGWNVVDFDLAVLLRIAGRARVPLTLGRGSEPLRLRPSRSPWGTGEAVLTGRLVLDGIDLLRGAFVRLESYALNSASREILGRGKTITGPDRAAQILAAFEHDRAHLVAYNRNDARLVLEILDHLHLLELTVQRSLLTGMPPDRVAASIAAFDYLYLSQLARRGIVAPTVQAEDQTQTPTGGHVMEPAPGLHRNVLVLDFRSLYPSIIRTFQIDPLGHRRRPIADDDSIVAPNGAAFSREPGILPGLLDELVPRREQADAAGDHVASHAIKILMNSFYGVLGTPACRFASPALANAITGFGREILLWSRDRVETRGHRVLYGDTDSLFVLAGTDDPDAAGELGERLAGDLTDELADHVAATWRVTSRLVLKLEKLYLRLLLPAMRGGTAGARKRYAGLRRDGSEQRVEFTGMEAVRRDWTDLARTVQRELYRRLFLDEPLEAYLRHIVEDLRAGRADGQLVYRKRLGRPLDAYTTTTPPHVAAARKMKSRSGRTIAYVMTREGPEPAAERRSPIDHEHYVQKQVRAVAEPVLSILGIDFDRAVGDERQMELF
jgi:DNA polymerase-2